MFRDPTKIIKQVGFDSSRRGSAQLLGVLIVPTPNEANTISSPGLGFPQRFMGLGN